MFGLTDTDLKCIVDAIKAYPQIDEAFIFGSRALNTHKKGSDIDIALKGNEIESVIATISGILNDESSLPYFCDILNYNLIDNKDLKNHIDRVGQQIYKKVEKKKEKGNIIDVFQKSPHQDIAMELERRKDLPRDVDF